MGEFLLGLIGDPAFFSLPQKVQWGCIALMLIVLVAVVLAIWLS